MLQKHLLVFQFQERLDFSCALFGPDGGLVANAPHIPVHLGAMQEAVQWQVPFMCHITFKIITIDMVLICHQMRHLGENLHEGDVILSNHPAAGGSHLPDLTVITPVSDML